ncbi:MAG: phage portal protein [Rhodobacteraceae bacterium]|nr:phage portal protein [Paracoccaceae bacterium]
MGILDIFRRNIQDATVQKVETRSAMAAGFTAEIMAARESYISGRSGLAELTSTVQACVTLWEGAFSLADVSGTTLLDRRTMGLLARSVALRGEGVFLIRDDRLIPCADWDLSTRDGEPRAYRVSVSEAGGSRSETALAAEVLHFRIASDPVAPWAGQAPLRRAALSASLLNEVETALRDVYRDAPLGSKIVHVPEGSADDMESMRRAFRGKRGATLLIEGQALAVAAGMHPNQSKLPEDLSPNLSMSMTPQTLEAARGAVCAAFGVLPALLTPLAQGPLVREAQRHLAGWVLQPMAEVLAEEATRKLGASVVIDVGRPLQAFDAGGRARALSQLIEAMGRAKELGLTPAELGAAFTSVNWGGGDGLA